MWRAPAESPRVFPDVARKVTIAKAQRPDTRSTRQLQNETTRHGPDQTSVTVSVKGLNVPPAWLAEQDGTETGPERRPAGTSASRPHPAGGAAEPKPQSITRQRAPCNSDQVKVRGPRVSDHSAFLKRRPPGTQVTGTRHPQRSPGEREEAGPEKTGGARRPRRERHAAPRPTHEPAPPQCTGNSRKCQEVSPGRNTTPCSP